MKPVPGELGTCLRVEYERIGVCGNLSPDWRVYYESGLAPLSNQATVAKIALELFEKDDPVTVETEMNRQTIFLDNMRFARSYTKSLLAGLQDDHWFWCPAATGDPDRNDSGSDESDELTQPFATHIAWQVGHLAMAQYGLCLFRQRGRMREDAKLMSGRFRKLFMKGTRPHDDPTIYPAPSEILAVLDRVYEQVMREVPEYSDSSLDEEIEPPTAAYNTKYGALLMAVNHEMIHAGQIGLLRRLMGMEPVR